MARQKAGWLHRHFRLFLALRYLKARRKQAFTSVVTLVSILGVTVGVAALIIALALLTGFQEDIQGKIIGANAHVYVQPFTPLIDNPDEVVEVARQVPGVVAAAPAVLLAGLIRGQTAEPTFVNLKGVDPRGEARTTEILDHVVEGSADGLLRAPDASGCGCSGIVLGWDLAARLFLRVGDVVTVTVYAPGQVTPFGGGGVRIRDFEVVAIFRAGMYEYDNAWALIPLGDAREMLEIGPAASLVQVRVEDIYGTQPVVRELSDRLGEGYLVSDWREMNRAYFAALKLEKLALFVTISLIVGVAALNIVATLVLTIKDKQRDIGILMSLGAARGDILRVFMIQGLVIGLLGTAVGCAIGVFTADLLDRHQLIRLEAQVYYLSYVPFHVRWQDFVRVCGLAVLISYAATLYPAWRASRLDPVVSLRYE